ncbi:MAG TPA: hypothetical protein VEL07_18360 [Planctomycetota bacterium]|nr:hypothetical protein [Planctomycetota bacterium]
MRRFHTVAASATLSALALAMVGCGLPFGGSDDEEEVSTARTYNGTASVGDFISIAIDDEAGTIAYENRSNGDSGTATFEVDSNGVFTIDDPSGVLGTSGYEVPGFALILEAAGTGPTSDEPSIITAFTKDAVSPSDMTSGEYNYMQFRTNSGGVELGHISMAPAGVTAGGYWPYGGRPGATAEDPPLEAGFLPDDLLPAADIVQGSDSTHLTITYEDMGVEQTSYLFRTTGGFFAIDTPNGGLVCVRAADDAAYDPAVAGSYRSMIYRKLDAHTDSNNDESGTPSIGAYTITLDAAAEVVVTDGVTEIARGTLLPVAASPHIYDGSINRMSNECEGAFTFRQTSGTVTTDVFVMFMEDALLISSFRIDTDPSDNGEYDYFYGVGLRDPSGGG